MQKILAGDLHGQTVSPMSRAVLVSFVPVTGHSSARLSLAAAQLKTGGVGRGLGWAASTRHCRSNRYTRLGKGEAKTRFHRGASVFAC